MLKTLKSKIILLVVCILLATATAICYFTKRDVGQAIFKAQEDSVKNVLHSVNLQIKVGYSQVLYARVNAILERKRALVNLGEFTKSAIQEFYLLDPESKTIATKKKALSWACHFSIGRKPYIFIFDSNDRIVAHPSGSVIGQNLKFLKDMKERSITSDVKTIAQKYGGEFAVFNWKSMPGESDGKKLAYFIHFPQWQWTIGVVINISDIEEDAARDKDKIIEVLAESFDKVKISPTSRIFLFNSDNKIIIPSRNSPKFLNFSETVNALTGNKLLEDIKNAVKTHKFPMAYALSSQTKEEPVRVYASYFKPFDWYVVVAHPIKDIVASANQVVKSQIKIIALLFLGSLLLISILVTRLSRPLKFLSSFARQIPYQNFSSDVPLEFDSQSLPIDNKDEVGQLSRSFLFMTQELKQNVQNLLQTMEAHGRIQSELTIAHNIQMGFLPQSLPVFSSPFPIELHAVMAPATQVGGDLYDFFYLDDDHLCFSIGDVSNKGIPAALFMVITKTLIKTLCNASKSTAQTMQEINVLLCEDNPQVMFVTLIIGILNIRTGKMRYCVAGHDAPIIISHKNRVYALKTHHNLVLGAHKETIYDEMGHDLEPNDSVFLYTDGVTESKNVKNEQFSEDQLVSVLTKNKGLAPQDMINTLLEKIHEHAADYHQTDDIAMMMIKYNGES